MDRRSWLWRRKSSEKSPGGESESSGSISSGRFSDGQASPAQSTHTPKQNSKSESNDEEINESVKALAEKLSAALININAKEELVKQHAKVAEEAVSGWEKAENEVIALKQQLEGANTKNSTMEARVGHLEGALKECVRQLRQSRDGRDQKLHEWETTKSVLENQITGLRTQLQVIDSDLRPKLAAAEKLNSALRAAMISQAKKLEMRVIERDLSTQAAEAASKQHLDSVKKMAKLEGECRKLKAMVRKISPSSESGKRRMAAVEIDSRISRGLDEISFMDDFLEMERLASSQVGPDDPSSKSQLDVKIQRTAELEEKLERAEEEKLNLGTALTELRRQLDRMSESKEATVGRVEAELKSLVSKACFLEQENERERALAAANLTKIQKLEDELSSRQKNARVEDADRELKWKQEKEIAMAAAKFAECQKTMASLSQQLNSLAALDEFLSDSDQPLQPCGGVQSRLHVQVR